MKRQSKIAIESNLLTGDNGIEPSSAFRYSFNGVDAAAAVDESVSVDVNCSSFDPDSPDLPTRTGDTNPPGGVVNPLPLPGLVSSSTDGAVASSSTAAAPTTTSRAATTTSKIIASEGYDMRSLRVKTVNERVVVLAH